MFLEQPFPFGLHQLLKIYFFDILNYPCFILSGVKTSFFSSTQSCVFVVFNSFPIEKDYLHLY